MLVDRAEVPPSGWNSYDAYLCAINEEQARANLEAFVEKLLPHGYGYFCLDGGWFADGDNTLAGRLGRQEQMRRVHVDEFGRLTPSPVNFPSGLRDLADRCHARGVKFGVHVMRGMPRLAFERNTPIRGCPELRARDIHDPARPCDWSVSAMAIDPAKPGAQAYYDSVVEYLADELTVDFIKLDDVVEAPEDIAAFARAVDKSPRPIVLSLSPGGHAWPGNAAVYRAHANMVRITDDVWDEDSYSGVQLDRWALFENEGSPDCWLDLDMLPLGRLMVGVAPADDARSGAGERWSRLSPEGKRVLMTAAAMACSPLFVGGDLPTLPDGDLAFVTHPEVLACNRNGVVGRRVRFDNHLDVRRAPVRDDPGRGWLGLFNRATTRRNVRLTAAALGFEGALPPLHDIWDNYAVPTDGKRLDVYIPPKGVCFLRYG